MAHLTSPVVVIGAGPAGLMAAETLAENGFKVAVFDAMPSVGRKFLMAGKGGLNITHAEPIAAFTARYGSRAGFIAPLLEAFGPEQLRAWIHDLGIATFVGTSGRVFPAEMKAAPLLRSWLQRLRGQGVQFHVRHRWLGWNEAGALRFATPEGDIAVHAAAVVLALGGGSWAKLGSDGAWVSILSQRDITVAPLQPANCGFDLAWSPFFRQRFAGAPVKSVIASVAGHRQQGEFNITATGIEGGLVYALSAPLRDALQRDGKAELTLDLAPGRSLERLTAELAQPQGRDSLANHLRRRIGLTGVKASLLHEFSEAAPNPSLHGHPPRSPGQLAARIKALPLPVSAPRPMDEAISTAGGVSFAGLDAGLMLRGWPGVFCAGEMLDWEAPTGGYLLTGCFSSGRAAGLAAACWLK